MPVLDYLLGRPLASSEEDEQKIGPATGVAVLGLDALSSAAYGPEAALTILLPVGALGLGYIGPISAIILGLLAVLYFSYRQTIAAYPDGGGSYTVAKENLGSAAGRLAAAALLLDYIMNVAVGISAGVGALVSAFPGLHDHILGLCLIILFLIAMVNLRGVRESGVALGLPTLVFVITLVITLLIGITKAVMSGGNPTPVVAPPLLPKAVETAGVWLLLRAFAAGCTAMTGVEAVSNGVTAFARPAVQNAQKTLTGIVVILGVLLAGIAYLARVYHIGAVDPTSPEYQSVISQLVAAVAGRGIFYYVCIASVLAVLALSANTSFADFPRLCRLVALDNYLPHAFASRGRRLVYSIGIGILSVFAALLLIAFGGITDRLIPLFAIGAFLAFTLSQAGMVVHWQKQARAGQAKPFSLFINAFGCVVTGMVLVVVLATKFLEGAWITLLMMPALLYLFERVRKHYADVAVEVTCMSPTDCSDFHDLQPPVVVVPIKGWNRISERALRLGLTLSPDVIAVHIAADEADAHRVQKQWDEFVAAPIRDAGHKVPELVVLESPYRKLFTPLLNYIGTLKAAYPTDRQIAVIIPELVESRWYQYPLHNQRATGLKAALLLKGDARIVVINVPWYLKADRPAVLQSSDGRPATLADEPTVG